jgi:ribosomal protein RSM22 (predicted rRNA methylase)
LSFQLIERERAVIKIGQKLSANNPAWKRAEWQCASLDERCIVGRSADLAVLSYVVAELSQDKTVALIDRLFEEKIALVAIIEPGTPKGFERIRFLREYSLLKGAQIIAPCPHHFACPTPPSDWCHFSARVERTRLHRQLKGGSLGHEDEKYSYVVYGNPNFPLIPITGKVIRPPHKGSGFVRLPLCVQSGGLKDITVTRSDKEKYRSARDAEWGSIYFYTL